MQQRQRTQVGIRGTKDFDVLCCVGAGVVGNEFVDYRRAGRYTVGRVAAQAVRIIIEETIPLERGIKGIGRIGIPGANGRLSADRVVGR